VHSVGQNLKFPIVFKSVGKNNIKIKEKQELILVFGVTLKQMSIGT